MSTPNKVAKAEERARNEAKGLKRKEIWVHKSRLAEFDQDKYKWREPKIKGVRK